MFRNEQAHVRIIKRANTFLFRVRIAYYLPSKSRKEQPLPLGLRNTTMPGIYGSRSTGAVILKLQA